MAAVVGLEPGQALEVGGDLRAPAPAYPAAALRAGKHVLVEKPLTLNAVVHRQNLDRLPEMIDLAERLGCRRIEVATVQFHGWADLNRRPLMPTQPQAQRAREVVNTANRSFDAAFFEAMRARSEGMPSAEV